MKKFWKVAAIVALAAIPLIILGKKRGPAKDFGSNVEDAGDIFERELYAD